MSNQDTIKTELFQSADAAEIVRALVPVWKKREAMHLQSGRTKKTTLFLEIEFFHGVIQALDHLNRIKDPNLKYSCIPPMVWVSATRGESIAENYSK
jgi:hypothetical protein